MEGPHPRAFQRRERHLMKAIPNTASLRKVDASLDVTLNSVALRSGEIVSWAVAFPRPDVARPAARPKATS
jgi:hypothetical protein